MCCSQYYSSSMSPHSHFIGILTSINFRLPKPTRTQKLVGFTIKGALLGGSAYLMFLAGRRAFRAVSRFTQILLLYSCHFISENFYFYFMLHDSIEKFFADQLIINCQYFFTTFGLIYYPLFSVFGPSFNVYFVCA